MRCVLRFLAVCSASVVRNQAATHNHARRHRFSIIGGDDRDMLTDHRKSRRDPAMIHGSCSDYRPAAPVDLDSGALKRARSLEASFTPAIACDESQA